MARPPGTLMPLAQLLKAALGRLNPREATAVPRIQGAWPEIAGPKLAPHITVWKLVRGDLKIKAGGSAWAQEFHFHRPRILQELHDRFPDIPIKDISLTP